MIHEIRLIDALEGMKTLESGSVSMIAQDPPYESLEKWRNMGTTTRLKKSSQSSNEWFATVPNSYFPPFFEECYRVLQKDSHMFTLCDEETADIIKPMIREAGFKLRKSIIWHKVGKEEEVNCPHCGHHVLNRFTQGAPGMGYPFRSNTEFILVAEKGKFGVPEDRKTRNFFELPEVIECPWIKGGEAYPTEKPVPLLEKLVKFSSGEGDLVLDPFAGSGSCGEAAFNLRREFLGFDVDQRSLAYFKARKERWIYPEGEEAPKIEGGVFDLFE